MKAPASGRWCTFPAPLLSARLRLFCFPYAGGAASIYTPWAAALRPLQIEVCAIQLPGRETRLGEAPLDTAEPVIAGIVTAMEPLLRLPFCFFGHSMGALIAFEVIRRLRRDGKRLPLHLFVSGARPPDTPRDQEPLRNLSNDMFLEAVGRRYGGIPPALLQHQDLVELILPALRGDLTLFETYAYRAEAPIPCPVSAFAGSDDPNLDESMLRRWREHTSGSFTWAMFPGDHFYLQKERGALLAAMTPGLLAAMDAPPPAEPPA